MDYKIGFIISEFLPTKKIVLKSIQNLDASKVKIYKVPVYSAKRESNNRLLLRILRETSFRYVSFKIFDTLFVRFCRKITNRRIDNYAKKRGIQIKSLKIEFSDINNEIINDEKFSIQKKSFGQNNFLKLSIGKKKHIKIKLA